MVQFEMLVPPNVKVPAPLIGDKCKPGYGKSETLKI
jgi:hypothetical protein